MSHRLQSGDQVEILTSKSQHVSPAWINFVNTAKAKAKIQSILRHDNRESQKNGEDILNEWAKKNSIELTPAMIDQLAEFHDTKRREEFFQALGDKTILLGDKDLDELKGKNKKSKDSGGGWRKYVPFVKAKTKEEPETQELFVVPEKFNRKKPIFINEDNIRQYKFPDCCHPIPGDDILGYIDNQNQIEIHKRACPVANKLKTGYGNRILDAKWDMHKKLFFDASIRMGGIDRRGLVNEVTRVLSEQLSIDIRRIMFTTEDGIFDGVIDLRIHDVEDLQKVINNLKLVQDLKEISRIM
jgi:GTP pyrophosphokinase